MSDARRAIPRTDLILGEPRIVAAIDRLGRARVKRVVVDQLARVRTGDLPATDVVEATLPALPTGSSELAPVLNAIGALVHTNLGRVPPPWASPALALAGAGRRVVVARGELVEIGDGFRIPDLIESFGAELRPGGTPTGSTSRTTRRRSTTRWASCW